MADILDRIRLEDAYSHCADIAHRSGSSFLAAFWLFPREQRRALHAIYAFCRLADDIADDPEVREDRRLLLARWRDVLDDAYLDKSSHPVGIALGDAAHRFRLRRQWFEDLLSGIESDLRGEPIERFEQLERYCYCVASTIGLLVTAVRGVDGPGVTQYAADMGIAVQLTNVLRDVGEDAASGRVYLAAEDLDRFGVTSADLASRRMTEEVRLLLALYAERARIRFERAEAALTTDHRAALRPAQAMAGIYRHLLATLHLRGFPCLDGPVRLSRPRRLAVAARSWATGSVS